MSGNGHRLTYSKVSPLVARVMGLSVADLEACFRPANPEDLAHVSRLRTEHQKVGHRQNDAEYLTWRYEFKPEDWRTQLWVLELKGEIIGTVGVERDTVCYKGQSWTVHKLMDILVREDHMGSGLGVWINLRLQDLFKNTFCIGSTKYSHSIVTTLFEGLPDFQTWRYPIKLQQIKGWRFGMGALNLYLRIRGFIHKRRVPENLSLTVGRVDDPALGRLRASMEEHFLTPSRSVEKHAWRLEEHPSLQATHYALRLGEEILASAAVCKHSSGRAEIYDLLFFHDGREGNTARTLSRFLTLIVESEASKGIEVLGTRIKDPVSASAFSLAGFILRKEPGPIGIQFKEPGLSELIHRGVPFFLMPADADYD